MGALHEGHLSLVKSSQKLCDHTIVSIFLNPLQFGENEDLSSYPANLEEDQKKLSQLSVPCVFIPSEKELCLSKSTVFVTKLKISVTGKHFSSQRFHVGVQELQVTPTNVSDKSNS